MAPYMYMGIFVHLSCAIIDSDEQLLYWISRGRRGCDGHAARCFIAYNYYVIVRPANARPAGGVAANRAGGVFREFASEMDIIRRISVINTYAGYANRSYSSAM